VASQHRVSTRSAKMIVQGLKGRSRRWQAPRPSARRNPSTISVRCHCPLERDVAVGYARSHETAARLEQLLKSFGADSLADLNGDRCGEYARQRQSAAAARRELEYLRINHHRREGLRSTIVELVLPAKGEGRERWLTRGEAPRLIRSARRYRDVQKGQPTGRRSRQHIARFLVAALYTTRRKGAILGTSLLPAVGAPWVDLERAFSTVAPRLNGPKSVSRWWLFRCDR
jgi:hypothetical protein